MRNTICSLVAGFVTLYGVEAACQEALPKQLVEELMKSNLVRTEEVVTHNYSIKESKFKPPTTGTIHENVYSWDLGGILVVYNEGVTNEHVKIPAMLRFDANKLAPKINVGDVGLDGIDDEWHSLELTKHGIAILNGKVREGRREDMVFSLGDYKMTGSNRNARYMHEDDLRLVKQAYDQQLRNTIKYIHHQSGSKARR